ncbi:TPA: hypothetical protein TUR75_001400 [Streptococcus equi subsp. zooepidemicus]|uniref:hypothetical protein n=1 Tax=Streptococcus equi TaxID=1336 RepID=UPI0013F5E912|nr:hypothetical protein [Streptococcus equi]MCD3370956.1 hypothetical protein [Streptococcus equi subsp. zooepidemicus]MCD3455667.1 hypothetical protein [Streptococcus equi subsp. zooepidemicus]QTR94644.1 hypothetical protein IEMOCGPF_01738 [Streptococcus equi subsp. zooepidemicus]WKF66633.1 hypothetical protein QYM01_00990 [Streptococcus equi subsp. zooepidemicus]HEL0028044.1 hypothetical protein [Streptococcus equi subsp. zooepidemicus]
MKKLVLASAAALVLAGAVGTVNVEASSYYYQKGEHKSISNYYSKYLREARYDAAFGIRTQIGDFLPKALGQHYIRLIYKATSVKEINDIVEKVDEIYRKAVENGGAEVFY